MTFANDSRPAIDPPTRRLTWLYVAALSFVAALSIAGQVLTQRSLTRQLDDSRIVNLAGRQRMLSQRLTQLALRMERAASPSEFDEANRLFAESFALWTETHGALRRGSTELEIPENDSAIVEAMFAQLDATYQPMQQAGIAILDSARDANETGTLARSRATEELLARESAFLEGMDAIVFQYDAEARARVAYLRFVEGALLMMTLATLAAEGTLIFRPAVATLSRYVVAMKRKNEELAEAERRAVEANQAKTLFLANMSHELRTPMNAVLGAAEIARERTSDDSQKRLLATLHRSAKSLLALLNDLLDLSQIDAGAELSLRSDPFNPVAVATDVAELYRATAERKGLYLRIETSSPEGTWLAAGDEDRFRQILSNLISNAIKFADEGGVELRIAATPEEGERVGFVADVIDTGVGIPPESRSRIFERFARADQGSRRRGAGAGLGLSIAAELVAAMKGSIELDETRTEGSRFTVRLSFPRLARRPEAIASDEEDDARERGRPRFALRILVADDSETNRLLLTERLADLGCTTVEAGDGQEALRLAAGESFDAVLLDVDMPEMDGLDVARELRKRNGRGASQSRLVAVTAYSAYEARDACLRAGFDGFLGKPIERDALLRELKAAAALRANRSSSLRADRSTSQSFGSAESPAETVLRRFAGREALLERLVDVYFRESKSLDRRLSAACDEGDASAVGEILHRWKGACSHFGWTPATAAFEAAERELQEQGILAEESLAQLHAVRNNLERALRELAPCGEATRKCDARPT